MNSEIDDFFKIDAMPIHEKLYKLLKESIIKQKIDISKSFTEKELAELFGVSRTPLREALNKLESDGFIFRKPNNRLMIAKLSIKHANNLYLVRSRLEGLAASLAAQHITSENINQLELLVEQAEMHRLKEENDDFDEKCRIFHSIIHKASKNNVCIYILNTLADHINRYRWISISTKERPKIIIEEHKLLLKYLKDRDSSKAEALMEKHMSESGNQVIKNLENTMVNR